MELTPFAELAALLLIAALAGAVFVRLRQPVLIAYLVLGLVLGPAGLGLVKAHDQVALLAQIGVTVLLLIVGLKLDWHQVRHIGPVALATGLGQLAFTIAGGFVLVLLLGKDVMTALYVAVALTFSSTIIIVKLLTDKRELDTLHGRIAVGFLIVQDLAVVLAMMAMSALRAPQGQEVAWGPVLLSLLGRLAVAVALVAALMRWVLPRLVAAMARSQELLLVFALAWGTALAALGEWAGFSMEAGAFIAGFTLASTAYREAIHARLGGVRDFLLLFFFIHMGAELDLSTLGQELPAALALSVFVLVGNPLIVMAIMGWMGYRKRTGFLAGLTVAQISEFSIVFVAMGISLGHVGVEALGLTTLVGLVTITLSTYMILYSQPMYERLAPWLGVFERRRPFRELQPDDGAGELRPEVVIFGLGRYGVELLRQLHARGVRVLGVDHDPEAVRHLQRAGLPVLYGDAENVDFIEGLPLSGVRWVVVTLPLAASVRALLHALRQAGYDGQVAVTVRDAETGAALRGHRVGWVLRPFEDGAAHAAERLHGLLGATPQGG
ncbi:Glutathione-regulated potassium-efflux system protein KefC [Tepidimonas alkaliphilus]|uniref:Glutathione-regulated potassium-efflux system protein KefC n=1 Tax=Tepidimonas alkaliphilus TaxID=2588942 RepID=A0A554WDB8_9BURK|nr:cation:proton antiporter family protein [Tepidimonas alkaliphilus]TSE21591.1 Glutathione-regulated potassium-efflux system protein KefC [Tepidimonas alkaliphilus]